MSGYHPKVWRLLIYFSPGDRCNPMMSAATSQPPKSKIRISGNPRFDVLRPELRGLFDGDARALREKYGPYILVATNFSRYNHFMGYDFWIEA